MSRLKKSQSRAATLSTCNQSIASLPNSMCSVHKTHTKQKSSKAFALKLNKRLRLLSLHSKSRLSEDFCEQVELQESKTQKRVQFHVFEDLKVFSGVNCVKRRVVPLTKDFDCSSDDELIQKEVRIQQSKIARQISKLKK